VTAKTKRADFMMVGVAYAGFIALGVPGTLLNIAWSPYIRETFNLSQEAIAALLVASTTGYFIATFTSGRIIARLGIGTMLLVSSVLGVVGLLGSALAPAWEVLIAFAVLGGAAGGLIDGGMNIYFAATYGPRLMNWLHAFFGVGATLGTWMMTNIIAANLSWRWGYGIAAAIYVVLAVTFALTRNRWRTAEPRKTDQPRPRSRGREVLLLPIVWIGVALFFVYGGLEVPFPVWSICESAEGCIGYPRLYARRDLQRRASVVESDCDRWFHRAGAARLRTSADFPTAGHQHAGSAWSRTGPPRHRFPDWCGQHRYRSAAGVGGCVGRTSWRAHHSAGLVDDGNRHRGAVRNQPARQPDSTARRSHTCC
jgi:hypothetical protein